MCAGRCGSAVVSGRPTEIVRAQVEPADVSPLVAKYRGVARSLWNTGFYPMLGTASPDDDRNEWDIRDQFEDIAAELFSKLVLSSAGMPGLKIAPAYRADARPLAQLKVRASGARYELNRSDST